MNRQIVAGKLLLSYVQQTGAKEGTVLFLHGWRSSKEVWVSAMSRLADAGHSVCAVDLPGFGGSQPPPENFSIGDYAHTIKGFIDKLGLKGCCLVGHSFGGRVAIKLASQFPETVSKLVLVDSAGFAMNRNKKHFLNVLAKAVKPFFMPNFMQPLRRRIYQWLGAEDYLATPRMTGVFLNAVDEDLSDDMRRVACPTLIIFGEDDKDTPLGYGIAMSRLMPDSRLVTLSGAGHFSFLDQPEDFFSSLERFVSGF